MTRANGRKPFISSHSDQITPNSVFNFNLVPVFLTLPDGQPALIVRSVNGTSYAGQPGDHTASTLVHPDQITLARRFLRSGFFLRSGRFFFRSRSEKEKETRFASRSVHRARF